MKLKSGWTIFIAFFVLLAADGYSNEKQSADFVFTNGKIYTVNENQPWAEAVAVTGNKIVYVRSDEGAKQLGIEDKVGSLEVGKLADMILLDQNIFEIPKDQIHKTRVLATMMDGIVWHDTVYDLGDSDPANVVALDIEIPGICGDTTMHTHTANQK